MRFLSALATLLCFITAVNAATIRGRVHSGAGAVGAATLSLLNAADSVWVRSELSGDDGMFAIGDVAPGSYLLSVTAVGYTAVLKPVVVADAAEAVVDVDMARMEGVLATATITAKKPFLEMNTGKLTVNVENSSVAITSNALELLRRLPGVTVDQGGNIIMHGKQGVLVTINDRPTYLTGEQLAEYLKSITPAEIAQLEIISQPGARYDAAGNTGVVNIKLKRNRKQGFSGTALVQPGTNTYAYEHSSLMLGYRHNKLNLILNATDLHGGNFADWNENQYFTDEATGQLLYHNNIHSTPVEHFSVTTLRLGADYDYSDKTTIGASVRGSYHPNSMTSRVLVTRYDDVAHTQGYTELLNPDGFIRKDVTANAYLSYKPSKTSTVDVNADYLTYYNGARQSFTSTPLNSAMQPAGTATMLRSYQPTQIDVYSLKADYATTLANSIKLEAGAKSSLVTTDNDARFSMLQGADWITDTVRTNRFVYKENINALYATASKDLDSRWSVSAGLRAEHTNALGVQHVHDMRFTRNYISLFPTAYITWKADTNNQFELNYGRRIDRPEYTRLNPFIHFSFQYSYFAGNPYLQPQFTHSIQLKHSYKNMLMTTLNVGECTNMMTNIVLTDNATRLAYATWQNLGQNKFVDVTVVYYKDLFKWLTLNVSGDVYYAYNKGVVGQNTVVQEGIGYGFDVFGQFNLGKNWKAEGHYYYSGRQVNSIMGTFGEQTYTSLGASKKVNDRLNLMLTLNDPFYKWRIYTHTRLPGFTADSYFRNGSRTIDLTITYSFGNGQVNQRKTTMDEKSRMKVD